VQVDIQPEVDAFVMPLSLAKLEKRIMRGALFVLLLNQQMILKLCPTVYSRGVRL
jgi:hypothetical protein